MTTGKWYTQGYCDALDGIKDPPMWPGKRDYENYMAGHADGSRDLERERQEGDYYGVSA